MTNRTYFLTTALTLTLALVASSSAHAALIDLTSAPAFASSTEVGRSPTHAFDDNNGTRWALGTGLGTEPGWIYVDLGASYTIDQVDIDWEGAFASNYTIRVASGAAPDPSSDLGSWTQVADVTGRSGVNGAAAGADDIFDFGVGTFTSVGTETSSSVSTGVVGQFVLLHITASPSFVGSIYEIDISGTVVPEWQ